MSERREFKPTREKAAKKPVVIEIGPAGLPSYRFESVAERWSRGVTYIGVDLEPEEIKHLASDEIEKGVAADMTKLPFRDNTATEIWTVNVFTDLKQRSKDQTDSFCAAED